MNAKKTPRVRLEGRTRLETVIPLQTPFILFVDPASACNYRCSFCFHRDPKEAPHMIMKFSLFTKLMDDLQQFSQPLKVLRLYKDGEPLLNKCLPEMIACAKAKGVAETVDFTTNGHLLTPKLNLRLIEAGLDAINISVGGVTPEKFKETAGVSVDFDTYVKNIRHLYEHKKQCRIHIKTTDVNVPPEQEERFYELFGDWCDEISIDNIVPEWDGLDISDVKASDGGLGVYNQPISDTRVCPFIFYAMDVNAEGTVSACFIDWEHRLLIGDARKESLFSIWHGQRMRDLQLAHLSGGKERYPLCSRCSVVRYCAVDNIDAYAGELFERLSHSKL